MNPQAFQGLVVHQVIQELQVLKVIKEKRGS